MLIHLQSILIPYVHKSIEALRNEKLHKLTTNNITN